MEHIAALLLIIGCSSDLGECRELPSPVTVFETYEECESELPASLARLSGTQPRILAKCLYVDPAMEEEDAELVWDVRPDGTLVASINPSEMIIASGPEGREKAVVNQE